MKMKVVAEATALPLCEACCSPFERQRATKRFCSKVCQNNSQRGSRKVEDSLDEAQRSSRHYSRAKWLAHDLYTSPPHMRLGFMAKIIEAARGRDAQLRSILTDPVLLSAGKEDRGLFHRKAPLTYKTISQAADAYCRRFWMHGVKDVIYKECPEPDTGESCRRLTTSTPIRGNLLVD